MRIPFRFILWQVTYAKGKVIRSHMAKLGLSPGQPKILDFLSFQEGCTQKDLSKGCAVEPATMSNLLDTLEKSGYIRREASPESRRSFQICLTETGHQKVADIEQTMKPIEEKSFAGFSEEEKELFTSFLVRYYDNLSGMGDV